MPNVKGKQYPYTPAGMLAASKASRGMNSRPSMQPRQPMPSRPPMQGRPPMQNRPRPMGSGRPNPLRKKGSGGARQMSTPGMGNMLKGKGRGY